MKYINTFIFSIILITIFGCNIDQPPGPSYLAWSKRGANELEIKKALLECGKPDPYGSGPNENPFSVLAAADYCMVKSGFKKDSGPHWCEPQYGDRASKIPVCNGAPIPQRSVARRLNSDYCKEWLKPENNPEVNTPECLP